MFVLRYLVTLAIAPLLLLAGIPIGMAQASSQPTETNAPVANAEPERSKSSADGSAKENQYDPETVALKAIFDEADVAFLAGRFADAAEKFEEGYQLSKMGAFLFNAAAAWERAGELEKAVADFRGYLEQTPNAPDAQAIQDRIASIEASIAENRSHEANQLKTKGVALFTSQPAGAEIRLDDPNGPVFALTPFRGTLPAGEHVVYVKADGYKAVSRSFKDHAGKSLIAHFALSEEYFLGHLEIRTALAGADVFLRQISDQKGQRVESPYDPNVALGQTPFSNQLPPGKWEVRIEKLGYESFSTEVDIPLGKVRTVEFHPRLVEYAFIDLKAATQESVGAEVYFVQNKEKRLLCTLPCKSEIPVGPHKIIIKKSKKKTLRFEGDVQAADRIEVEVTLEPATKRTPAYVTGALTLGAIGAGIYFGLLSRNQKQALQQDLDDFVQIDQKDSRAALGRRNAIIADSLYAAGAILGALTLYYALRETGKPSRGRKKQENLARRLFLAPTFGPRQIGLGGEWRF